MNSALTAVTRLGPPLRTGVFAGLILAGLIYPLAAAGGIGVKTGAAMLERLPRELTVVPSAQTSYVYAADGRTLLTMFFDEHRRYVPLTAMSPHIQDAIVAAEDSRFYQHDGVDLRGVMRAFVANRRSGEIAQGASTLTMQYVRAALRDSARTPAEIQRATEQTSARKLREMRIALEVEKQLSKQEILERYLNLAYFGHQAYGIYAAAEVFFSKQPKDLTVSEAATLAGLVKAPSTFDPAGKDNRPATERRDYIIDRMVALDYLDPVTALKAKRKPIALRLTRLPNGCAARGPGHNDWGFFCDYFHTWWTSQAAFGSTPEQREQRLRRGGYRIVTTLDPQIQRSALKRVLANESRGSMFAHGTVVVEAGTGRVRAMAVNRTFSLDQSHNGVHSDPGKRKRQRGNYPNTVNALLGGGTLPGYQAGSTFKMFTMLAALEAGQDLNTYIYAPYRYRSKYRTGSSDGASCAGGGLWTWCPSNASKSMTGRQSMWSGFGKSVNTYFVQLEERVGAQKAVRMAERLGLRWRTDIDRQQAAKGRATTWGAFTLGVADTTPLEMANAYATVAAEGVYCEPLPVLSVTGLDGKAAARTAADGRQVPVATPRCHREVSKAVARAATDAARCVTGYQAARGSCGGWSTAPWAYGLAGRPIAGKTGTTDQTRAAWFVGFTPQLAAASFIADPDNPFHVVGDWNSAKPVNAVARTLHDALSGKPVRYFNPPPESTVGHPPAPPRSTASDRQGRAGRGTAGGSSPDRARGTTGGGTTGGGNARGGNTRR